MSKYSASDNNSTEVNVDTSTPTHSPTETEHDYETNSLGGTFCKRCGKLQTVPDWPPYCKKSSTKPPETTVEKWGGNYPYKWNKHFYSKGAGYDSEPHGSSGKSACDETLVEVKGSELSKFISLSVQEAKAEGRKEMDWEWEKVHEVLMREQAERIMSELDIVWVCPPCAKKFFNRGYTEGKTNISTAVHRQCEACHEYNQCMHHRSYDLLTSLRKERGA